MTVGPADPVHEFFPIFHEKTKPATKQLPVLSRYSVSKTKDINDISREDT